jgi:nucleotide-binding universal stress UspA family protein
MNYQFKKILIGFDNSASSLMAMEKALEVCKAFGAELYVVNVKDPKHGDTDYKKIIENQATANNIIINFLERKGNVSKEIHAAEKEINADLIFMGAHGLNGFQPYWIGSNAMRVVGSSSCPVITVQADSAKTNFSEIILPLDNSAETRQKVPYAVVLAKAFNSVIHVLSLSRDTTEETKNRISIYGKQTCEYLEKYGIKYTFELLQGKSVAATCIDYAVKQNAGLIMMMTETESDSWFMGTVAQQLINHSPVPVLSIHSRDLYLTGESGY